MTDTRTKDQRRCGNCEHSFPNDAAVGVRLGCWKNYVDWFVLPHELRCKGKAWEPRIPENHL